MTNINVYYKGTKEMAEEFRAELYRTVLREIATTPGSPPMPFIQVRIDEVMDKLFGLIIAAIHSGELRTKVNELPRLLAQRDFTQLVAQQAQDIIEDNFHSFPCSAEALSHIMYDALVYLLHGGNRVRRNGDIELKAESTENVL